MKNKLVQKTKRLLSGVVAVAMAATMLPTIPAFAATGTTTYSYDGYTVDYTVVNEWDNGQAVEVKITNTGEESILNWAFKYDAEGKIDNLWNATIVDSDNTDYVIKNSGWNYEITPNQSVTFGYVLTDDDFVIPTDFELCSERVEISEGYDVNVNITNSWDSGVQGELVINNTSDSPVEAWTLTFDTNFVIDNLWDGRIIENTDTHYTITSEMWTNPIPVDGSTTIGFVGTKCAPEEVFINNFSLSAIILKYDFDDNSTSSLVLNGFSEYGANVLSWSNIGFDTFDVFKGNNGDFNKVKTIQNANYYIDETALTGNIYEYYVSATSNEDVLTSNIISIETSSFSIEETPSMPNWIESMMILEEDYAELNVKYQEGDNKNYVSQNVELSLIGNSGSSITWESNNISFVSNDGIVNRSYSDSFIPVILKATLEHGGFSMTKSFELNVAPLSTSTGATLDLEDLTALNNGVLPDISYSNNDTIEFIDGVIADFPVLTADDAFEAIRGMGSLLGIQNIETEIKYDRFTTNSVDNVFYFSQYYNGIEILGASITVISNKETGLADYLYSTYINDFSIETIPTVSSNEAIDIAIESYGIDAVKEPNLIIYNVDPDSTEATLAWEINTESNIPSLIYIDAHSGEILYAEMPQSAQTTYKESNTLLGKEINVNVEKSGILWWKKYKLFDSIRNITIVDGTAGAETEYIREDNDWSDVQYDDALAALSQVSVAYDFFDDLGWQGYDNNNSAMTVVVHYQEQDAAGIWQNVSNAWSSGGRLGFGDGNGSTTQSYISDIDTVGHEFTHSVTGSKIGIQYKMESGAISEAYSDIFGELMDPKQDWLHGTEIRIGSAAGNCGRDLINPDTTTLANKTPAAYLGSYYGSTNNPNDTNDYGNLHKNSTVISHAAYLMLNKGIPLDDLAQIWYNSYDYYNNIKLPYFMNCRFAVTQAANRLYGENSTYSSLVQEAFDEVNVKQYEVSVIVKDAITGEVIPNQSINIKSANKAYCDLTGSCCYSSSCRSVTCDPDTCMHSCDYSCYYGGCSVTHCCNVCTHYSRTTNDNGMIVIEDLYEGYHRLQISSDGYEELNELIFVDRNNTNFVIELETPYTSQISGKLTIADDDVDMTNNSPLKSATLTLTKLSGTTEIIRTDYSDDTGTYSFDNLPAGTYELKIHKYGYIDIIQTLQIKKGQTAFYNFAIEVISEEYKGKGYASGTIYDAIAGTGVDNLTLEVYSGILVGVEKPSSTALCTITSYNGGRYKTEALDAGNYTIFVCDEREGISDNDRYMPTSFTIKVLGNTEIMSQNGTVSNSLDGNQLRIVLSWGSTPRDLDSHLLISASEGSTGHVYYGNRTYFLDGNKIADLDLDDTSGYGPETTTIYAAVDGTYTFYVHDFTNSSYGSSNYYLSNSGATVYVYSGYSTLPIATYSVPTGLGTIWKVFSYDSTTGEITPYNTISTSYS